MVVLESHLVLVDLDQLRVLDQLKVVLDQLAVARVVLDQLAVAQDEDEDEVADQVGALVVEC